MKLVDLSITEFAKVLGSDAPAPGGGSAAALSAANGLSLTNMVCELTIGKKKYAEFEEHIKGCLLYTSGLIWFHLVQRYGSYLGSHPQDLLHTYQTRSYLAP